MTLLTESLSGSSGHFTQFNESWKRCGRFGSSLPSDKPRWSRTSWPPVAAALSTLRGCIYRALQMSHLAGCPLFVHQIYRSPTLGRAPWFTTRTLPLHRHQLPPLWLLQIHHLAFSLLTVSFRCVPLHLLRVKIASAASFSDAHAVEKPPRRQAASISMSRWWPLWHLKFFKELYEVEESEWSEQEGCESSTLAETDGDKSVCGTE